MKYKKRYKYKTMSGKGHGLNLNESIEKYRTDKLKRDKS